MSMILNSGAFEKQRVSHESRRQYIYERGSQKRVGERESEVRAIADGGSPEQHLEDPEREQETIGIGAGREPKLVPVAGDRTQEDRRAQRVGRIVPATEGTGQTAPQIAATASSRICRPADSPSASSNPAASTDDNATRA